MKRGEPAVSFDTLIVRASSVGGTDEGLRRPAIAGFRVVRAAYA
jgi:hypothetical protein